jgi:hypothetical protein
MMLGTGVAPSLKGLRDGRQAEKQLGWRSGMLVNSEDPRDAGDETPMLYIRPPS